VKSALPPVTQEQLDAFKKEYPDDMRLRALTLKDLLDNTGGGVISWPFLHDQNIKALRQKIKARSASRSKAMDSTLTCAMDVGFVIYDCVCLAIGGVALRAGASAETAEAIADAAAPVLSKVEQYIAQIAAEDASYTDMAWAVFNILKTIWNGGMLSAVLGAFLDSLSWYYYILYAATALATIIAAFATDGLAFVAEVVIELATFGFLVADSITAVDACTSSDAVRAPASKLFRPVTLTTHPASAAAKRCSCAQPQPSAKQIHVHLHLDGSQV